MAEAVNDDAPVVVIVAQAFKETLPAAQVAAACETAVTAEGGRPVVLLGSDGGDGLLEALGAELRRTTTYRVSGPRGDPVAASVGWLKGGSAVVESRLVCGLSLLPGSQRDPLQATTRGLGELIGLVEADGAASIYVGLGGSATMDGGVGMARAWGWVPRDDAGEPLPEGGGALARLAALEPGRRPGAAIIGLADVRNPLTGPRGARVYAAQKGATAEAEERLAAGLERLVAASRHLGSEALAERPGAGAAGGLGFGIMLFGGGELVPGAGWVLDRLGFDDVVDGVAGVVTGEGAFDATSMDGKLTGEVLRRAEAAGVRTALLAPAASSVPAGVIVESGGGRWDAATLARRARAAVGRMLRLPRP